MLLLPGLLLASPAALAADLLLTHARLWDGTGAPVRETSILVRDGHIAGFDPADPGDATVVDLAGATVLPGLIDGHVHLVSNPGNYWRTDDEQARQAQVKQAMRAYLACGVTTVLDAGTLPAWGQQVHDWLDAGEPGPEVLDLGVALSPPGGYLDQAFPGYPSEATPEDLRTQLDASDALGAIGYKVAIELGYGTITWPVFDAGMRAALAAEATARGKGLFVHATNVAAVDLALSLNPTAMVHVPDHLRPDQLDALITRRVAFSSTLLTTEHFLSDRHQARMSEPLEQLVIPAAQRETALSPGMGDRYRAAVAALVFPKSRLMQRLAPRYMANPKNAARALADKAEIIAKLRAGGLVFAMGSDAGNWPLFPFMFHGPSSLRELELLGEVGLSPEEALAAATREGAKFLGIEDRTGTVEIGKEADLVVFREDPLGDLHRVWSVIWTMSDGELRSPEGWMHD